MPERKAILDDLAEIPAELQPHLVVLPMIVDLVAREEQHVGIDLLYVGHDILSRDIATMPHVHRVSREAGDYDLGLVDGILADRAKRAISGVIFAGQLAAELTHRVVMLSNGRVPSIVRLAIQEF